MAGTTSRRPTRPASALPPPAQQLPPQATSSSIGWLLVAVSPFSFGGLLLAGQHIRSAIAAAVVVLCLAFWHLLLQARRSRRAELRDRLVEALAIDLGTRQLDRRTVVLARWSRGWPGTPRDVRLRYAPRVDGTNPVWKGDVLKVVESRLLAPYEIVQHDQRRCKITLRRVVPTVTETAARPRSQVRAERALTELLGPSTQVVDVEVDSDEELRSITIHHEAGVKLAAGGYRARVERIFSTMNTGRWRAKWDLEADTVRLEQRPSLPASVWVPTAIPDDVDDLLSDYRRVRIQVAVDEDGHEIEWAPAVMPQAMVVGGTGSGKTSTNHAILGKTTQYGWPAWVVDPKRVEFLHFRDWPNVQIVATTLPQQVAVIHRAWILMETRYRLIEEGKATVNDFEPLVLFLDEFAEFRSNLLEWYARIKVKGDPTKPVTLSEVASLARKARTARIHLVLSTQRPDAEFLGGEMRDNFAMRIAMGRLSPQGAMMMWENPATGVTLPRSCIGRATAVNAGGVPVEVQAYRFPDFTTSIADEQSRLQQLRPGKARHPRLVVVPPDPADLGVEEPTFNQYLTAEWDLAENRPDLDPAAPGRVSDGFDGREASSTMASLGLVGGGRRRHRLRDDRSFADRLVTPLAPASTTPPTPPRGDPPVTPPPPAVPPGPTPTDSGEVEAPPSVVEDAMYAPPVPVAAGDLLVGDLIEADEGSDSWVVVDEEPIEDPSQPGLWVVSWRDDADDSGTLEVPDDAAIQVRRPIEEETP